MYRISNIQQLIALSLCFFLVSCGLRPIYDVRPPKNYNNANYNNALDSIQIAPIDSIYGAELYYALQSYFPLTKLPQYLLRVNINYSSKPQAIQSNSNVIREIVTQDIRYQLLTRDESKLLTSGAFSLNASYNTNFSPYANYTNSIRTNKDLAKYAAVQIRQRIILNFALNFKRESQLEGK